MYTSVCQHKTMKVARRVKRTSWSWFCILMLMVAAGALHQAKADVGDWKRIGKAGEWKNTIALATMNDRLYTIESGGLYRINPANGSWGLVGKADDWSGTRAVALLADQLYSANKSGALYQSSLATGRWVTVGKRQFGNTAYLFVVNYKLYSIEADGSLYAIETVPMAG